MALSVGLRLMASIINSGSVKEFSKLQVKPEQLKPAELDCYEFIQKFIYKHKSVPKLDTLLSELGDISLPMVKEVPSYYANQVTERYISDTIKKGFMDIKKTLEKDTLDVDKGVSLLTDTLMDVSRAKNAHRMVDFKDAEEFVGKAYKDKKVAGLDGSVLIGYPSVDVSTGGLTGGDVLSIVGRPAMGKSLELETPILLSTGKWIKNGDLVAGDKLASIDGKPNKVTGVYPQGFQPVYKLTFSDGRVIRGSSEHLWQVTSSKWGKSKVLTTLDIQELLTKERYQNRLTLVGHTGTFGEGINHDIDPWLLGFLLGDGCFRGSSVWFTNSEEYIVTKVRNLLPDNYKLTTSDNKDYRLVRESEGINLHEVFKDLNLWGCKSEDKFIPEFYLSCNRKERISLLAGLLEADGWVQNNSLQYSTASIKLSTDTQRLVQSLGGKATYRYKSKTMYKHKGELLEGLPAHILSIAVPYLHDYINSPRVVVPTRKKSIQPYITSIDYYEDKKTQCISVSHKSKLYIMDKYMVTHNTFHTLNIARNAWYNQKKTVLYVSMEMNILSIQQRLVSMHTKHNLTQLKKGELSTKAHKNMLQQLSLNKDEEQSFWVVDGNLTATVEDVWKLCMQVNPDFVVVDGAYLLKHPNPRIGKYEKVAENAELLKQMIASDINVPNLNSWQFNRDATKKMEGNKNAKVGLEDIGSTDVIGQISSVVLGLTQSESVETLITRKIDILKGRNGETGSFMTNWDFVNMDFSEIVDNPWIEGQYEEMQQLIVE